MRVYDAYGIVSPYLAQELKKSGYTTYDYIGVYLGEVYYGPESMEGTDVDNFNLNDNEFLAPTHHDVVNWLLLEHGIETALRWDWADHGVTDRMKVEGYSLSLRKVANLVTINEIIPNRNIGELHSLMDRLLANTLKFINE